MTDRAPIETARTDGQTTSGLRRILSSAAVYESFQRLMGKSALRDEFASKYIRPTEGMRVLDVGCGPGDMAAHCSPATYVGVDMSDKYIDAARSRFGDRATFHCAPLEQLADTERDFDVAICVGVLHHLADPVVRSMSAEIASRLRPGGRFVALEPHFHDGQHPISRSLIRMDRGQNVRTKAAYEDLLRTDFEVTTYIENDMFRVPYSLVILDGLVRAD